MQQMGNTEERQRRAVGTLVFKLQTDWLQWKAWVWTAHLSLPTNMTFFEQIVFPLCAATDFCLALKITLCRLLQDGSTGRDGWDREREDESCLQVDVLPHPASLSGSMTSQEFITIAVHTSARHCLHVKAVIVVKCLFPSGKREKRKQHKHVQRGRMN